MDSILLLLSPGPLRDRLFQILQKAGFIVFEMAGGAGCPLLPESQSEPITYRYLITDMNNFCTKVQLLKGFVVSAPQAHVVLLVEGLEPNFTQRQEVSLASCVLSSSISSSELLEALNWARLGERVIQRCLLASVTPPKHDNAAPPQTPAHRIPPSTRLNEPSPREKDILRCLVLGYTNKMIARHLHITEATVKVHSKSLLKKIPAKNRTEAAIWALNAGYGNEKGLSQSFPAPDL
jgi:two-component system, NarL family, nitrate/nitrite response regulator NarL